MRAGMTIGRVLAPVVVGAALLALWWGVAKAGVLPAYLLPGPGAVLAQLQQNADIVLKDTWVTAGNAAIGLAIGVVLAILFGAIAAVLPPIGGMLAPVVAALAVIPIVALTPMFNTMFGASAQTGRQLIAAIAAFVPVYINLLRGLRQAQPVQRDVFRAYAATGGQKLRKLTLLSALPFLLTGVRIASSLAVISALVAEYMGGPAEGLGDSIKNYSKIGNNSLAWAFVVAAIVVGLVFFLVTVILERIVARYRPAD